jgi:hypothetical protein
MPCATKQPAVVLHNDASPSAGAIGNHPSLCRMILA